MRFFTDQQIVDINVEEPSVYEAIQFEDFEKLVCLVKSLSDSEKIPQLYCHLPYYDYILFCYELFIIDKMSSEALASAIQTILQKRNEYIERITAICVKHNVKVKVSSPFDNIFGDCNDYEQVAQVLEKLQGLGDQEVTNEKDLVKNCLKLLADNNLQEQHSEIWKDFIKSQAVESIITLEELFKVGSAVMVAVASCNKSSYQVCSLLALSEEQIQINYAEFSEKLPKNYPAIINLTYLDPVLGYNHLSKGNLFYFNEAPALISRLISFHGILNQARKNAGIGLSDDQHRPLEKVLQGLESAPAEKLSFK